MTAALPFWSPDSRSIGFFARGKLRRVDIANGAPRELCDVLRGRGGAWNRDGVIVFAAALNAGLSRISANGGEPQVLTKLGDGQRSHRFPFFLPDGRRFLYYAEGATADNSGVFAGALDGHDYPRILAADSAAVYAHSGHLLFVRQATLFAQPFDAPTLRLAGEPAPVAESVPADGTSPAFSVSDTGLSPIAPARSIDISSPGSIARDACSRRSVSLARTAAWILPRTGRALPFTATSATEATSGSWEAAEPPVG